MVNKVDRITETEEIYKQTQKKKTERQKEAMNTYWKFCRTYLRKPQAK
jgi:hypothetical protein